MKWAHIGLAAAAFIGFGGDLRAAELRRGRCHMETCEWFEVESRKTVGTSKLGRLVKVEWRYWSSYHPEGSYHRRTPRKEGNRVTSYVFCSKTRPALIDRRSSHGGWDPATVTPGDVMAIGGATISDYIFYFAICHRVTVDEYNLFRQTVTLGKNSVTRSCVARTMLGGRGSGMG